MPPSLGILDFGFWIALAVGIPLAEAVTVLRSLLARLEAFSEEALQNRASKPKRKIKSPKPSGGVKLAENFDFWL
jgi:hypothetical protein